MDWAHHIAKAGIFSLELARIDRAARSLRRGRRQDALSALPVLFELRKHQMSRALEFLALVRPCRLERSSAASVGEREREGDLRDVVATQSACARWPVLSSSVPLLHRNCLFAASSTLTKRVQRRVLHVRVK